MFNFKKQLVLIETIQFLKLGLNTTQISVIKYPTYLQSCNSCLTKYNHIKILFLRWVLYPS